jgi:uncharacterized membrane protein
MIDTLHAPAAAGIPYREDAAAAARAAWVVAALVGLLTLGALALRVFFASRSGLWRDEALFLFVVNAPSVGAMLDFLRLHESHPPLFYLLMRAWLGVWGHSETAALALPVLLGGALIPVIYGIGSRVFSRTTGLIAAALAAVSGALAENAALVRPYSLLPLLCLLSTFLLWRALHAGGGGARRWLAYAVTTAALLYTHNWAWLILGAQWVMLATCVLLMPPGGVSAEGGPRGRAVVVREAVLAQAAVLALYAPWFPVLKYQTQHAGHGVANPAKLLPSLSQFATVLVPLPDHYGAVFCVALAAATAAAALVARRRRRVPSVTGGGAVLPEGPANPWPQRCAVLLFLGVPLVAFGAALALNAKTLLLLPRCLAIGAPCALLAIAHGVGSLPVRPFARLTVVLGLAVGCLYVSLLLLTPAKSNAREVAAAVAANARRSDLIVIAPEQLASSFNYYFKGSNPQINFPVEARQEATRFDNWVERCGDPRALARTKERIVRAHGEGRGVWLVLMRGLFLQNVPDDDARLPRRWVTTNFIGVVRASQILEHLTRVYGPPQLQAVPGSDRDGDEILIALRFEPNGANGG